MQFDKVLRQRHVIALAFGAMIGWSWVLMSGLWIGRAGTLGAVLAFVLFGVSLSALLEPGAFALPAWVWLALNGLVAIPLATMLLARGPRVLPSADVSMFFMLETVLTPVWIWLLFGEVPPHGVLLGGSLVVITLLAHSAWRLALSMRGAGLQPNG